MVGVAAHAIPNEFRDDLRAALPCEFKLLEHEYAGAFAHDKTIAVLVEGPGCPFGSSLRVERARIAGIRPLPWE